MEISNFYSFGEKLSRTTFQVQPINLNFNQDNRGVDDVIKLLMGNFNDIEFPVVFKHTYGNRLDDILRTGHSLLYLISDKMKLVLEKNSLTGWSTFDVKILDKQGKEVKGYFGLSITGRSGKIDYNKSNIIEKRLVPNGRPVNFYKGLHVGLDEWDGTDFFLPEKFYGIIVTQKVFEILNKSKITNVQLENLKDVEVDYFTVQVAIENR